MAKLQNIHVEKVIALSAQRPAVTTLGKATEGHFIGENTGAVLYYSQQQTANGAIIRSLQRNP